MYSCICIGISGLESRARTRQMRNPHRRRERAHNRVSSSSTLRSCANTRAARTHARERLAHNLSAGRGWSIHTHTRESGSRCAAAADGDTVGLCALWVCALAPVLRAFGRPTYASVRHTHTRTYTLDRTHAHTAQARRACMQTKVVRVRAHTNVVNPVWRAIARIIARHTRTPSRKVYPCKSVHKTQHSRVTHTHTVRA